MKTSHTSGKVQTRTQARIQNSNLLSRAEDLLMEAEDVVCEIGVESISDSLRIVGKISRALDLVHELA